MPPLEASYPFQIILVSLLLAIVLLVATRAIHSVILITRSYIKGLFPRRIAIVFSFIVVGVLLGFLFNGFILKQALDIADSTFDLIDREIADGVEQPKSAFVSGSKTSLINWNDIGKQGKNFIVSGPKTDEIAKLAGHKAMEPIRVYAGYRTGQTLEERAQIVLNEMIRVGAFNRTILVVATPTGTGWMDEGAVDTLEVLHRGDTAIVTMQYSYLPSWITLIIDPDRSKRSAGILFDKIYAHWTLLPKIERPKLYIQGLSLGAMGGEHAADIIKMLRDPINGALFSGPPFPSSIWNSLTNSRNPDSPQWLPIFRDGSLARFTLNGRNLEKASAEWGPLRMVYLQHASDPMSFFSTKIAWEKPDWLSENRGPDVTHFFDWFPIVTFLQVAFDIPAATSVPIGYGHNFAPWEYIGGWLAVTEPAGWSNVEIDTLKEHYKGKIPR